MRRTDEAFKKEVLRRYSVQKRNRRNYFFLALSPLVLALVLGSLLFLPQLSKVLSISPAGTTTTTKENEKNPNDPEIDTLSTNFQDYLKTPAQEIIALSVPLHSGADRLQKALQNLHYTEIDAFITPSSAAMSIRIEFSDSESLQLLFFHEGRIIAYSSNPDQEWYFQISQEELSALKQLVDELIEENTLSLATLVLSSDAITEIRFMNPDFSQTTLSTSDPEEIQAFVKVLEMIEVVPSESFLLKPSGITLTFHYDSGASVEMIAGDFLWCKGIYSIAYDDVKLLSNCTTELIFRHLPSLKAPAPESYLHNDYTFIEIGQRDFYNDVTASRTVRINELSELIPHLQTALKQASLITEKPPHYSTTVYWIEIYRDKTNCVLMIVDRESNLLIVSIYEPEEAQNAYYFTLPEDVREDLCAYLGSLFGTEAPSEPPETCEHDYKDATCFEPKTCRICHDTQGKALGHTYQNDVCITCGLIKASQGLEFALNADGKSYAVSGIGSCTDTDLIIPNLHKGLPVTTIGENAFAYLWQITRVTLPDTITAIEAQAFKQCYIKEINLPDGLLSIGDRAFSETYITKIILPDSLTSLGKGAFASCDSLTDVTLSKGITRIEMGTFSSCSKLVSITIPSGVTALGSNVFSNCDKLQNVILPDSIQSIGTEAFSNCPSLESITLPKGLTAISGGLFTRSANLKYVNIPRGVETISTYAFSGCESLESITIPNTVTRISAYAFSKCTSLVSITIPNSVQFLGEGAFQECTNLESVTLSGKLSEIQENSFNKCINLKAVNIPVGVTFIREGAFSECESLKSVTIPNTVECIYAYAFTKCKSLVSITIPDSVHLLKDAVFEDCTGLETVTLSKRAGISDNLFHGCTNLKNVTIPGGVSIISEGAFSECRSLQSITIPTSIVHILEGAFADCDSLTGIILHSGIFTLENEVFAECDSLQYIVISDSVDNVGQRVFGNTPSLRAIYCDAIAPTDDWSNKWLKDCNAKVYWRDEWTYVDGVPTAK